MSIVFSRGCEYGIQAALFIAAEHGRRVGIREIAGELGIPVHFLAKILQALSEKGILESYKGSNGGFTLKGDPADTHLISIVEAIDGTEMFKRCVLGFPECGDEHPCPLHERWGRLRETFREMLSSESLADYLLLSKDKISSVSLMLHEEKA